MATTTKKGSKRKKAKPRRAVVKTSSAKQAQTNAELRQQLAESLQREKGNRGAANGDEQDSWRHCELADRYSACIKCYR